MSIDINRELLKDILRQQNCNAKTLKESAVIQYEFSARVSTFMNNQELHNHRIKSLLESDPSTNKEGLVEEFNILKNDFNTYKNNNNRKIAFASGIIIAVFSISKWIVTKIFQ